MCSPFWRFGVVRGTGCVSVCVCACCAHFWCFTPDADASTSTDYSPPSNRPHQPSPPLIRTRTHTHTLTHQHYNAPETPAIRKSTWVRRLSVFHIVPFSGHFLVRRLAQVVAAAAIAVVVPSAHDARGLSTSCRAAATVPGRAFE